MSTPLVFKFGGASVKDADSVRNVARIIGLFAQRPMVVVVSAMGKTTNAFEEVVGYWSRNELELAKDKIDAIREFHFEIIEALFEEPGAVKSEVQELLHQVSAGIDRTDLSYGEAYDFIVHHGELISTKIIAAYIGQDHPYRLARYSTSGPYRRPIQKGHCTLGGNHNRHTKSFRFRVK
jgi:aspartate kinase